MHRSTCLAVLAFLITPGERSRAQSTVPPSGYAEYFALLRTPIGALPPVATSVMIGVTQTSPQLVGRFGYVPDVTQPLAEGTAGHEAHSMGAFALTGILPVRLDGSLFATVGVANIRCTGCRAGFMASAGGDYRVLATALGNAGDARNELRLTVAVTGEVGFGKPEDGSVWSAEFGVPLALSIGSPSGTRLIPFLVPAIAYVTTGEAGAGAGEAHGARGVIGGGVALRNPKSPLGGSVTFQYISVARSDIQIGVALSLGGR